MTDIDISIMEGVICRILGSLRESFLKILDLRPLLYKIETSPSSIYDYYIEDVRSMSGILVEIIIYSDNSLSGRLNMFYPESTLNQLQKRGKKDE